MEKIKVGFFSFTCCEGCILSFVEVLNKKYFEYMDKFKFQHIRILKPSHEKIKKMDVAFIEGAISNKEELKKLKEIRKKSKILVALGSGADTGWPSNLSNDLALEKRKKLFREMKKLKQFKKILPLKEYVKVDDVVPGCPIEEKILIKKIDFYIKEFENA